MATLGELTGAATHEFNNLLMTILNYAKLGLRHKDEASRDKAFQRIFDAASKAGRLSGGILALARNRSDNMEPTDLRQVTEDAVLLLEREFRKYQVQLELRLDKVPDILGQGNDLQRMIINRLVNARQATPAGGAVRVTLKELPESNEVVLSIRDTGCGIPAELLPRSLSFSVPRRGPISPARAVPASDWQVAKRSSTLTAVEFGSKPRLAKEPPSPFRLPKASSSRQGAIPTEIVPRRAARTTAVKNRPVAIRGCAQKTSDVARAADRTERLAESHWR